MMSKTPIRAASLAALIATAILTPAAAAKAAPKFRMPFKCGQKVYGQARADHSPPSAIDFNGLGGGDTDLGMPVVAAARGKVTISTYYTSNGYGNAIQVSHGNGYATFYAHLRDRKVAVGKHVKRGQLIGHVGKSSAKYTFTAHLHYEERLNGSAIQARFNGGLAEPYRHMEQSVVMKSGNCKKKGGGNPPARARSPPAAAAPAASRSRSRAARQGRAAAEHRPPASPATIQTDNGLPVSGRRGPRTAAEDGQAVPQRRQGEDRLPDARREGDRQVRHLAACGTWSRSATGAACT